MGIWDNKLNPSKLDWIWQLEQDNKDLNLDLKDKNSHPVRVQKTSKLLRR